MTPAERETQLAQTLEICVHLAFIKVSEDEPRRIRVADIREDLRADFERYQLSAACPGEGYAYAHDFHRWAHKFSIAVARLQVPLVSEEPFILLYSWNLLRMPGDTQWVLIGLDANRGTGRRSTHIQSFDFEAMRIKTASGRLYQLMGKPQRDGALEAWIGCTILRELGGETWV